MKRLSFMALAITLLIVPSQTLPMWAKIKQGAYTAATHAGNAAKIAGSYTWDATKATASGTWNVTKPVLKTGFDYSCGISKIGLGSGLLGIAATQALLVKQYWNEILIAQRTILNSSVIYGLLKGTISQDLVAPTLTALAVPALAASAFFATSALGSVLVAKGAKDIWNAEIKLEKTPIEESESQN